MRHRVWRATSSFALVITLASAAAAQDRPGDGTFTMALAGDAMITRRLSVYTEPEFLRLMGLIRMADVGFTNLEMLLHDYEPYPAHQSGGTYFRAEPAMAKELAWAGFDLVATANNHTGDYGVEGMRLTQRHLSAAGLVHAGTGENLYEAREARFLETAHGRVALISVAASFYEWATASKAKGAVRGRPGLNPLHRSTVRVVSRDQLQRMRTLLREMGIAVPAAGDTMTVSGTLLAVGEQPGLRTTPNPEDVAEIAAVVRSASRLADYVILSVHAHESGRSPTAPAEFVTTFARAMIEAGADVVAGHGPHHVRGVEIHRGKPIFYGLGDLIFQLETMLRQPRESYDLYDLGENHDVGDFNEARFANDTRGYPIEREVWESALAVVRWRGKELAGIELHPVTLGFGQPRTVRGRPMLANPELGRKIIGDLSDRSQAFGTTIEWREGIGVVRLKP